MSEDISVLISAVFIGSIMALCIWHYFGPEKKYIVDFPIEREE